MEVETGMKEIVAVVVYRVDPARVDEAIELFRQVIEPTHAESGALTCALTQGDEDRATLVLVERWASQDAIDQHIAQPYVATFGEEVADLLSAPPQVLFLHDLPIGDSAKGRV
jgi:quinol monooxygenase YgiN